MDEFIRMYPPQAEAIDRARGTVPRSRIIAEFLDNLFATVDETQALPMPETESDYAELDLKRYHISISDDRKEKVMETAKRAGVSYQRIYYTAIALGVKELQEGFAIKCTKSTS